MSFASSTRRLRGDCAENRNEPRCATDRREFMEVERGIFSFRCGSRKAVGYNDDLCGEGRSN